MIKSVSVITDGIRTFKFKEPLEVHANKVDNSIYEPFFVHQCFSPPVYAEGLTEEQSWKLFVVDFVRLFDFVYNEPDRALNEPGIKAKRELRKLIDRVDFVNWRD